MAQLIYEDTEELLAGLTSSDTGQQRSAALESFNNNINLFQEKVEEIASIIGGKIITKNSKKRAKEILKVKIK